MSGATQMLVSCWGLGLEALPTLRVDLTTFLRPLSLGGPRILAAPTLGPRAVIEEDSNGLGLVPRLLKYLFHFLQVKQGGGKRRGTHQGLNMRVLEIAISKRPSPQF